MKEALVGKGPTVQIVDSAVPEPNDDQVLIKVVVSGTNPKDYKIPAMRGVSMNSGDDIAGVVEKVGAKVYEFKPGDRVAAFHEIMSPGGSYAEYATAPQHTTFHIPKEISFEDAAALPLAGTTAALALFLQLGLPQPWSAPLPGAQVRELPLIIYGASSSVGFYALQFALHSNIHPILCVAGRATDRIRGFIDPSKGDVVVDYREGDDAVVESLKNALKGKPPVQHALDAVTEGSSAKNIGQVLELAGNGQTAKATFVSPVPQEGLPKWAETSMTFVGGVHKVAKDFGYVYTRYIARGLQEGWFQPQRTEVIPGGLGGVQTALENLRDGKASATKYVVRLSDTSGI